MGKRGISAIVATVLIILVTVAAVAIIWLAIVPMISENVSFDSVDVQINVVSSGGYTTYDATTKMLTVQVARGSDDGVINEVKIIIRFENGDSTSKVVEAPGANQMKTYEFRLSGGEVPVAVAVAPIVIVEAKEKEGAASQSVEFSDGSISENFGANVFDSDDIPTTGLVSWWRFDGDYLDSVGGNDGTLYGGGLVVNGDFETGDFSGWPLNDTGVTIVGNAAQFSFVGAGVNTYLAQNFDHTFGEEYIFNYTITENTGVISGEFIFSSASVFGSTPIDVSVGTHSILLIADNPTPSQDLRLVTTNLEVGDTITIDDISVYENSESEGVEFDGVDDYVDMSSSQWSSIFREGVDFTILAWVNPNVISPSSIVGQRYGDSMVLALEDDGKFYLSMDDTRHGGPKSDDVLPVGDWSHVAISYTSSDASNVSNIYFNGQPSGGGLTYDGSGIGGQSGLYVGWQSRAEDGISTQEDAGFFNGSIDEVMIYDRALSVDEITAIYENQKGGKV